MRQRHKPSSNNLRQFLYPQTLPPIAKYIHDHICRSCLTTIITKLVPKPSSASPFTMFKSRSSNNLQIIESVNANLVQYQVISPQGDLAQLFTRASIILCKLYEEDRNASKFIFWADNSQSLCSGFFASESHDVAYSSPHSATNSAIECCTALS